MQKKFLGLILAGIILTSCSSSTKDSKGELNDKKAQLEKLKSEQKTINDKIAVVEAEIAKLDPKANEGNAKLVAIKLIQPLRLSITLKFREPLMLQTFRM